MKNSINFQMLNGATRYRSSNPLVNAVLVLVILMLIPVLIVVGIMVFASLIIIAKVKTLFSVGASEKANSKKPRKGDAEEFTDYVVIDEQVGK